MRFQALLCIIIWTSFSNGQDTTDEEPTDAPQDCGQYRDLARLPNPLRVRGKVCCEDLGCFSNEKGTPWGHMPQLPKCMKDIQPEYHLFTPDGITDLVFDYFTLNDTVDKFKIIPTREFVAIIHGYNTKWPAMWMFAMKDEFVKLGHNVLLVRWTLGSNVKDYMKAAAHTRTLGKAVGIVIQTLVDHDKVRLEKSTIIGFSLGAHTAGYAGSHLKNLRRIIGLDPAGPLFVCEDVQARLDFKDAKFVQIIHSNGESFLQGGLGTLEPLGHVDFYVNGGKKQPGCPPSVRGSLLNLASFNLSGLGETIPCSHKRCPWIFVEMLRMQNAHDANACPFVAFPCDGYAKWKRGECFSCPPNGCPSPGISLDVGTPYRGKFFFNTLSDNSTTGGYCGRQFLTTLTTNVNVKGSISLVFNDSNNAQFQKSDDTVSKDTPTSAVVVTYWDQKTVNNVTFIYHKYKTKFGKDGPSNFHLSNMSVKNINGSV